MTLICWSCELVGSTYSMHFHAIEKELSCFHGNVPGVVERNGVVPYSNGVDDIWPNVLRSGWNTNMGFRMCF